MVARRVGARVGRAPMPAGGPAPVACVLVPAQLAARRRVAGTDRRSRGPMAVPVLAFAAVVLTWVDVGMLRTEENAPPATVDPVARSRAGWSRSVSARPDVEAPTMAFSATHPRVAAG